MIATRAKEYYVGLQNRIVTALEKIEGKPFRRDSWDRPEGGGGISCLIEDGAVFERAVVSFSHVFGQRDPARISRARVRSDGCFAGVAPTQPLRADGAFECAIFHCQPRTA